MVVMRSRPSRDRALAPFIDRLRQLRFVRGIRVAWAPELKGCDAEGLVTLRTPRRSFKLGLEIKRAFLDRTTTGALIADHLCLRRQHGVPLLVAARYIPRPTGERLAAAGVNFVDTVGNLHIELGDDHHVLLLGQRQVVPDVVVRRPSPALTQLLFVLLADPATADLPVRGLAEAAGIGRTAAAAGRQRLVAEKVLRRAGRAYQIADRKKLADQFLDGYGRLLRPRLLLGRFRAAAREPRKLLERFSQVAPVADIGWAVTGAQAAYALQRFYRDERVSVFVTGLPSDLQRELRLVPDREGPVLLLRAFGTHYRWRQIDGLPVAHPWLVYAELVQGGEQRAIEAAEQFREEYLRP
jgi:hypothetical protein